MRKELQKILIQRNFLIVLSVLLLSISVVGLCIFIGVVNTPLTDPLSNFQAPNYIPEGYVSVENNTTAGVDKSFTFADKKNNNYFMVAAVKDMNKSEYRELINDSFIFEEMDGMHVVSEDMIVDGHPVTFKILSMDFMGMQLNVFHVSWVCSQSGLNMFAIGKIGCNEKESIQKMVASIQCHKEKRELRILGLY